jgi:galactokinase
MERKNTIKILGDTKIPLLAALDQLKGDGIFSVRDFYSNENNMKYLDKLDETKRIKLAASIDNYRILKEAEGMLKDSSSFSPEIFGKLIKDHHANLRDALNISTPIIEKIMDVAYNNGALGGKVNGSGGGGCLYVYAHDEDSQKIVDAVRDIGYPGKVLKQDCGVCKDKEEYIS